MIEPKSKTVGYFSMKSTCISKNQTSNNQYENIPKDCSFWSTICNKSRENTINLVLKAQRFQLLKFPPKKTSTIENQRTTHLLKSCFLKLLSLLS